MFLPVPNGSRLDIIFKLKQRGSEMHFVDAKWILTGSGGHYGMNIYRGCTHGCIYCDSRSSCYRSEERRVGKECRSRWSPYH